MITGELRNHVDKLWTEFWTGGITNPLMVIEQISFLMFARLLDIRETREEKKAKRTRKDFKRIFPKGKQNLRWSQFKNVTPAAEMLRLMRDEVFPHFKEVMLNGGALAEYMKDAQLMIQKPNLLVSAVNMIDKLPLTEGDTKGRPVRIPAQQAHHGGDQRPVSHPQAYHPQNGGDRRSPARCSHSYAISMLRRPFFELQILIVSNVRLGSCVH